MKVVGYVFLVLVVAGLAFAIHVRTAGHDVARWHVDPAAAAPPGQAGWLVRSDIETGTASFDVTPAMLLEALDGIAVETPRTTRLAGSPEDGRITYVTRSRVFGFPDYTTVTTEETVDGTAPVILGRARYGKSDLGVNRARIEGWLDALRQRLGAGA